MTDVMDDVTERGLALYEERLRPLLEPAQNGDVVAIHVDSGDYQVAETSGAALRAMRTLRPTGQLLLHTIGTATDANYGLVLRMQGVRPLSTGATTVK